MRQLRNNPLDGTYVASQIEHEEVARSNAVSRTGRVCSRNRQTRRHTATDHFSVHAVTLVGSIEIAVSGIVDATGQHGILAGVDRRGLPSVYFLDDGEPTTTYGIQPAVTGDKLTGSDTLMAQAIATYL